MAARGNLAYFEDVVLGGVLETPAITVTEAHVTLYLGLTRELAADASAVPDLLPLCLTTGLGWRIPQPPLVVLAFMGCEWHAVRPLRVGDTMYSRSRTVTKRSMREGGVIVEEREVIDQHDEVVQRGRFTFLVAKRPPAGAA
ncbi:MAG: MaoC family dehydratase [Candidatus Rokuibacteriota bacterium]